MSIRIDVENGQLEVVRYRFKGDRAEPERYSCESITEAVSKLRRLMSKELEDEMKLESWAGRIKPRGMEDF